MPETTRPDAIMMPAHCGVGDNDFARLVDMRAKARKHLGVNLDAGELAYCRSMPAGQGWFCTRDLHDTILFPNDHPMSGTPRYAWTRRPDGVQYGILAPDPFAEKTVEQVL